MNLEGCIYFLPDLGALSLCESEPLVSFLYVCHLCPAYFQFISCLFPMNENVKKQWMETQTHDEWECTSPMNKWYSMANWAQGRLSLRPGPRTQRNRTRTQKEQWTKTQKAIEQNAENNEWERKKDNGWERGKNEWERKPQMSSSIKWPTGPRGP